MKIIINNNKQMISKQDDKNKLKQNWKDVLHAEEYHEKFNKLLNKIQAQNRYSNRITNLNILNLSKLEKSLHELSEIKEIRKMEEINQVQLRNLNNDLNKQIDNLKEYLEITSKAYFEAKKQIKELTKRIGELEKENLTLNSFVLQTKRRQLCDVAQLQNRQNSNSLENVVKSYLQNCKWRQNLLIRHCRQCLKNTNFSDFFLRLDRKIEYLLSQGRAQQSGQCLKMQRSKSMQKQYDGEELGDKKINLPSFGASATGRTYIDERGKKRKKIAMIPLKYSTIH